ncbi:MAG: type III pantothenate kinase [Bacilli bacterium]
MNLCIDVGNSTIGIGVFSEDELIQKWELRSDACRTDTEFYERIKNLCHSNKISFESIEGIMYSSVVPSLNSALKKALLKLFNTEIFTVNSGIKTGLMLKIDNPNEVGGDLIADLVAAKELYPKPSLIVDLGTASKILYLSKEGNFCGCLFMPGLITSSQSLSVKASLLPEVGLERGKTFLAKNTIDAMNNGLLYGHAEMISGLVNKTIKEVGTTCSVILTGGCSNLISDLLPSSYIKDENLVLKGLNILFKKNKSRK